MKKSLYKKKESVDTFSKEHNCGWASKCVFFVFVSIRVKNFDQFHKYTTNESRMQIFHYKTNE